MLFHGNARMYLPAHFAESRTEVLHALMRARPFATLVTQVGIAPERALAMATSEPARLIGLQASHGALLPGRKTEMVRLGPDFQLIEHWL